MHGAARIELVAGCVGVRLRGGMAHTGGMSRWSGSGVNERVLKRMARDAVHHRVVNLGVDREATVTEALDQVDSHNGRSRCSGFECSAETNARSSRYAAGARQRRKWRTMMLEVSWGLPPSRGVQDG